MKTEAVKPTLIFVGLFIALAFLGTTFPRGGGQNKLEANVCLFSFLLLFVGSRVLKNRLLVGIDHRLSRIGHVILLFVGWLAALVVIYALVATTSWLWIFLSFGLTGVALGTVWPSEDYGAYSHKSLFTAAKEAAGFVAFNTVLVVTMVKSVQHDRFQEPIVVGAILWVVCNLTLFVGRTLHGLDVDASPRRSPGFAGGEPPEDSRNGQK